MAVTRQEVERELERKSVSISESIQRLRKEFSLPIEPVRSAVRKHPEQVILGTIAVGLAVGWLAAGRRKKRPKKKSSATGQPAQNSSAAEFLRFLQAGRAAGLSEEEAVAGALAARTAVGSRPVSASRSGLTDRLTDYAIDMVEAMVRTGLRVAAREAAAWIADSVRREKPKEPR